MQLYSAFPGARSRQVAADLGAIALVVLSIALGIAVSGAIAAFADFGRQVADAGSGLQKSMTDAASTLGGLPLLGDAAAAPFREASGVGAALAQSGEDQQRFVRTLAVVAGLLVALLPMLVVLPRWMRRRAAFARRATTARRLADTTAGTELLALRALTTAAPRRLLEVDADPVGSWKRGDTAAVAALADLELRAAGVRTP
jgi:hypothetical protein